MSESLPEKREGRKAVKYRGVTCLNCGHPLDLSDVYCSYCGQLNSKKKLSLADFFREFFASIFNYESRLRYTLKDLLFKPGTITKNYVEGKRLRYANPFRFFLSTSIIYFLLQGLVSSFTGTNQFINWDEKPDKVVVEPDSIINLAKAKIPDDKKLQILEDTLVVGEDSIPIKKSFPLKTFQNIKKDTAESQYTYYSEAQLDTLSRGERLTKRWSLYHGFYESTEIKNPDRALDSLHHEKTAYNRWLYSKNESWNRIKDNPTAFLNYLLNKVPFFLFFFAPFFALFFWLIYSWKKYTYMEHLVFIFHIFGFVFLGMLICFLPDLLLGTNFLMGAFLTLVGPFYFYKAMRNFYRQNRIITIIKFLFLNFVFAIGALITALLFFAVTAATY